MVDPSGALPLFQRAMDARQIELQRCTFDPNLYLAVDQPGGRTRFCYMRFQDSTITALAMFAAVQPLDDLPCFQMGIAVPLTFRRQGLGQSTVKAGIVELKAGLARVPIPEFFLEAVVSVNNEPSKRIAVSALAVEPKPITDKFSGEPALLYVARIGSAPT
jgi:hypothetical protein